MQTTTLPLPAVPDGTVLLVEAERGPERSALLDRWLADRAADGRAWRLPCDTAAGGTWAGVAEWVSAVLPEIERDEPDLLTRHDSELVAVLPALTRRIQPRYVTLTDIAPQGEAVRNYATDRAYRIGHGLVDLLDAWKAGRSDEPWAAACDDFDRAGALATRFFAELARRRGRALRVSLLVAVAPGAADAAAAAFGPSVEVRRVRLALRPGAAPPPVDREATTERMVALEKAVADDPVEVRLHLHELIAGWADAGFPDRAAAWRSALLALSNHLGYYADALRHAPAVEESLARFDPSVHLYTRSKLVTTLYVTYTANQMPERALAVVEREGVAKLTRPDERARAHYMMAMLHIRYLPKKDAARSEWHLEEALRELAPAEMDPGEKHFLTVFLLNGLAFVRHRQGRAQEAVEMTRSGFRRLDENLPPERHRLHRSVLLFNAAQVYASTGALDDAERSLTAAMEMDPHYSEYYNDRGNVYLKMGRLDDAVRDYHQAIEFASPYPEVWVNLGQCHAMAGRWAEALAAYDRAVDLEPERAMTRVQRARTLTALERRDEALAEYDAALALEDHPLVRANRAALRFAVGRVEDALADLDTAVATSPETAALHRNRAAALRALDRPDEAADALETYLRVAADAADRAAVQAEADALRSVARAA